MIRLIQLALVLVTTVLIYGCGAIQANNYEKLPDENRYAKLQDISNSNLCNALHLTFVGEKTKEDITKLLNERKIAICINDGKFQYLGKEGSLIFDNLEIKILNENEFKTKIHEPECLLLNCPSQKTSNLQIVSYLDEKKLWLALASFVLSTRLPDNLTYTALGRAAQHLDEESKAIIYYEKALDQSTAKCSDNCNTITFEKYIINILPYLKNKIDGTSDFSKLITTENKKELIIFLQKHPQSKHKPEIISRIKLLESNGIDEWEKVSDAKKINTTLDFLENNPKSIFLPQAKQLIDYLNTIEHKTIAGYLYFLKNNPNSKYTQEIKELTKIEISKNIVNLAKDGKCDAALGFQKELAAYTDFNIDFDFDDCSLNKVIASVKINNSVNTLLAIGMKFESESKNDLASKAYSSIIDNYPSHDLSIKAGERLIFLKNKIQELAASEKKIKAEIDTLDSIKKNSNRLENIQNDLLKKQEENNKLNEQNKFSESYRNKSICLSARQTCLNSCPKSQTYNSCTKQCGYCN